MQDLPTENFQHHEKSLKSQKRDKTRKYMRYNHGSGYILIKNLIFIINKKF